MASPSQSQGRNFMPASLSRPDRVGSCAGESRQPECRTPARATTSSRSQPWHCVQPSRTERCRHAAWKAQALLCPPVEVASRHGALGPTDQMHCIPASGCRPPLPPRTVSQRYRMRTGVRAQRPYRPFRAGPIGPPEITDDRDLCAIETPSPSLARPSPWRAVPIGDFSPIIGDHIVQDLGGVSAEFTRID